MITKKLKSYLIVFVFILSSFLVLAEQPSSYCRADEHTKKSTIVSSDTQSGFDAVHVSGSINTVSFKASETSNDIENLFNLNNVTQNYHSQRSKSSINNSTIFTSIFLQQLKKQNCHRGCIYC